jgi:protein-disulfide isomerase
MLAAPRSIAALGLLALFAAAPGVRAQSSTGGVSLAGVGHDVGSVMSRVFIVEFGDFGCSYCAKFNAETYPRIDSTYIAKGIVRWKMIPFVTGMFRHSREVTEAAECAGGQGAFWKMHDLLYLQRKEWTTTKDINALVLSYSTQLNLNRAAFARCLVNPEIRRRVFRHDALARQLGIQGTPMFYVNGRRVPGAVPFEVFQQVIAQAAR